MGFMFMTCDRTMALGFLRKLYPSRTVTDTPDSAGPLLDYVDKDIVRIPDPDMHGVAGQVQIMPSTNWRDDLKAEIVAVAEKFHNG